MSGRRVDSWRAFAAMVAWRYAAHSAMLGLALWNEARPAPSLPDLVLRALPRVDWIARHNYQLWLVAYAPPAFWLLARDRAACIRFLWVGGWLSLLRGATIVLTGLGPVDGVDVNAGASGATLWHAWLQIVNPVTALTTDAPNLALTKDLFFSGHVATTFLLWLYCRGKGALGPLAFVAHVAMTATVLLARLHYSIDVVGAWGITLAVYALFEGGVRVRSEPPPAQPARGSSARSRGRDRPS